MYYSRKRNKEINNVDGPSMNYSLTATAKHRTQRLLFNEKRVLSTAMLSTDVEIDSNGRAIQ